MADALRPRGGPGAAVEPAAAAGASPDLAARLDALARAIEAADSLGLDSSSARAVFAETDERLRLPIESFVLAFVGGTGVGKSSLLNALAGSAVSPVGVQRPTTGRPIAWMSRREPALESVLRWLDVAEVRAADDGGPTSDPDSPGGAAGAAHTAGTAEGVGPRFALVDVPDLDSIDAAHRRRVEELLPRIDAVAWVVDPEKYADALLHRQFLGRWAPRLGRQVLVVNKSDLLSAAELARVADDVARLVAADGASMPVVTASARGHHAGVAAFRDWLDGLAAEKAVAVARLGASAADAVRALAAQAGIPPDARMSALVSRDARRGVVVATRTRLAEVMDAAGLERSAVEATSRRALEGTGPIAPFRSAARAVGLGGHGSGRDPRRHVERWRERASLLPAAEPAVTLLREATAAAPPALRPALAGLAAPAAVGVRLEAVLDAVPAAVEAATTDVPSSPGWGTLGMLQALAVGAAVVAAIWLAAGVFIRLPIDLNGSAVVAIVVAGAVAGIVLRLVLGWHARYLGRRWGRRLVKGVERAIGEGVEEAIFGPLDRIEFARTTLARSVIASGLGR